MHLTCPLMCGKRARPSHKRECTSQLVKKLYQIWAFMTRFFRSNLSFGFWRPKLQFFKGTNWWMWGLPGFPSLLWRQNICDLLALCWLMQPQWVQPKATYLFMRQSRAFSWCKPSRSVSCTTTTFSFSRCRRGQFCSNLLVPCLMCVRAAHGIPLRWDQEESRDPFVVFPAFSSRILKTAARNNGNLRAVLASELSFEYFAGRRTSLSNKSHVTYNILPWHC